MRYIAITDLDGTLLDHQTYDFTPALSAIEKLTNRGIPLILNSSKTQVEIQAIRQQLNNHEPFVCENGGIICGMGEIQYLATPRRQFLERLTEIKQKLDLKFQSFGSATVEDVVQWTGLSVADARNAMKRNATEPLLWQDTESALDKLRQELADIDLQCVKGGRFYHVMGMFNKASCFGKLKQYYGQMWQEEVGIVALGDSPNDLPMLERADFAIAIPPAKGHQLQPDNPSLYLARHHAPYGWKEGIDFWLETLL